MERLRVAILGATGMVGQQFAWRLAGHPWFQVTCLAASPRSAGRSYAQAVEGRWSLRAEIPQGLGDLEVKDVADVEAIVPQLDFAFCALAMDKEKIRWLEEEYARREIPVVSANSAHRWTPDVPVLIPEVNAGHLKVIPAQRQRLGTRRGFVVVKPNCSIQPYVPALDALWDFGPRRVWVCTYQALSGAGRTLATWPEMGDNVIPFIAGEEEKSEREPLKIWGRVEGSRIVEAGEPRISAQCVRVPVSDGHLACVSVEFAQKPPVEVILERWAAYRGKPQELGLPSAPVPFLRYLDQPDRPQTRLDREMGNGMAVALGRLRPDPLFHYRFVALSHNTARGAAGGSILTAELLHAQGYLSANGR
jgi:aspartate-semialdehyde dehydrogenase